MTANQEYQNGQSKTSAKRCLEIPLIADWFTRPEFADILAEMGYEAAGIIFALSNYFWRDSEHIIRESEIKGISWTLHVNPDKIKLVRDCALKAKLFTGDSKTFSCPFITRAAVEHDARVQQLRQNGRSGGRPKNQGETNPKPIGFGEKPTDNQTLSVCKTVDIDFLEGESKEGEPPHPLESQFQKVEPEIGTGRLPLKKYPKLRLTPGELETVLKRLDALGLASPQQKSFAFENAEAQAGKNPRGDCYCWLLSWATENAVSLLNEAQKLKRNGGSAPEKKHYKDLPPPPARPNGDLSRIGAMLPEVFAGGAK